MTRIAVASPIRPSAGSGNDVTARRWAGHLRAGGHEVAVVGVDEEDSGFPDPEAVAALGSAEVLIALHARRSAPATRWWWDHKPDRPVVIGLAGTDLYRDMPDNAAAMAVVDRADALIVLQDHGAARVAGFNPAWADKTRVVHQSTDREIPARSPAADEFRVVVLAHLREVKDPLLAARAARLLPDKSRVVVHHAGRAHDDQWQQRAETEEATNRRYVWHRELDSPAALALMATAHVLACTSLSEGGANVVTEAMAAGVPVIGTRIGGNTGILGDDHPGWFPVGDADAMAALLHRLEADPAAMAELATSTAGRATLAKPETEQAALLSLVDKLAD